MKRLAWGVLALALFGCSAMKPARKASQRASAPPAPPAAAQPLLTPPAPGPVLESKPPLPSVSVGPRGAGSASPSKPAPKTPSPFASLFAPKTAAGSGTAPPIAPPVPAAQRGRFVVLNFDSAEIETVVQATSEILGFNYVIAPDVRGKVTVQTSGRIPHEDVFNVLLAVLEVHGFTAVKSGNLYKIVRIPDAASRAVPTIVGAAADPSRDGDEILTQVVPVRYANVNELRTLLQPLVSQQRGTLIAHRDTNVLVITDTASNVRRLLDIVRLVDVEVALEEVQIIPLHYADAAELAQILTQLFASGRLRSTGAPGAPPQAAPPPAPAAPGAVAQPPRGAAAAESALERGPLILAERRSNSLVVHARRNELESLRTLIGRLDVNIAGGRRIFIYYAENAKAKELAATLNAIYGKETAATAAAATTTAPTTPTGIFRSPAGEAPQAGPTYSPGGRVGGPSGAQGAGTADGALGEGQFRFIADETTNSIIVATYPRYWTEFEETLKQLDRSPRQVLIEVLVAEITLTDDTRLGIEWAVRSGRFDFSSAPGLAPTSAASGLPASPPGTLQGRPGFRIPSPSAISALAGLNFFTFATDQFFAALNAFASENRANVLSSPSIMTSENKKAVINVSDSIPIVTSQQVPIGGTTTPTATNTSSVIGTQTVEYRDAGVILTVTPRIGERGTVALDVKQEVNDVGDPEPPTGSRRIIKREAETSVVLLNNQTLVLGGLIRDRRANVERGIPVLQRLPIIGYLFGAKQDTINKTELLILITPRVIGTAADAAAITEKMRQANPQFEESFRKGVELPPTGPSAAPPPPAPAPPAAPQPESSAPAPPAAAPPPDAPSAPPATR